MPNEQQESIARHLRRMLKRGKTVEIEGLGKMSPAGDRAFHFVPESKPRVFLAYVEEDLRSVLRLYEHLKQSGFNVWLDKKNLLPGQNWPRAIETAIQDCDYFIGCFSRRSVGKRGVFQSELRYALECARRLPLDEIFVIPARLEACALPERIVKSIQYVDLFPEWDSGLARILRTLNDQEAVRQSKRLPLAG